MLWVKFKLCACTANSSVELFIVFKHYLKHMIPEIWSFSCRPLCEQAVSLLCEGVPARIHFTVAQYWVCMKLLPSLPLSRRDNYRELLSCLQCEWGHAIEGQSPRRRVTTKASLGAFPGDTKLQEGRFLKSMPCCIYAAVGSDRERGNGYTNWITIS